MRCYYCDFCPTAPSLSTLNERRSVELKWDAKLQGWTCGASCFTDNAATDDDYGDILEVLDGRVDSRTPTLSEP